MRALICRTLVGCAFTLISAQFAMASNPQFVCSETARQDCDAGLQICTAESERLTTWKVSQNSLAKCLPENRCTRLGITRSSELGDFLEASHFAQGQRTVLVVNKKLRTFDVFASNNRRIFLAKGFCVRVSE